MKVSYEEIGAVTATFQAGEDVKGGMVVAMSGSGQVDVCSAGDRICGVALEPVDGYAAVQVRGFVTVHCGDSTVTPGWNLLSADGDGGVKADTTAGTQTLVAAVDSAAGTAVILL